MKQIALLSRRGDTIRAAVLRNRSLVHLDGDALNRPYKLGAVYQGKVKHIERGQSWIDLDPGLGLLTTSKNQLKLTVGQTIPVQISREAFFDSGQNTFKSPLLSQDITLNKSFLNSLIPNLETIDELVVDDTELMANIKSDALSENPHIKLTLSHKELFSEFGLNEAWDNLFEIKITVGSLNLTIEETSACTIIDINGSGNIQFINQQAVKVCSQQITWRSLSGAILIEFINHGKDQRQDLIDRMKESLPSPYYVHGFSKLGFLEISCLRKRAPLTHRFILNKLL